MYFFLLCLSAAVYFAVAIVYIRANFSSVFHPISFYLAFHGWVFVIRPFFAYAFDYNIIYRAFDFFPSPETKAIVLVCANLGLLAFVVGAWGSGGVAIEFRQGPSEVAERKRLILPFMLVLALCAPIGIASLWTSFTLTEWTMRTDFSTGVTINTTVNGWFTDAQMLLVPISVIAAWIFRFRWWSMVPLVAFVTIRAGTGGRGAFIVACVAAGLLWLYDHRRTWPSAKLITIAFAVLALFYAIGQDRGASIRSFVNEGKIVGVEQRWGFMESMDWANMEFFEYLVETIPRKTGTYGYFVENLQVFTEPIPRKLWKNKPVGAPIKPFNLMEHGRPFGMTRSLPGEGWAQAGYLGVILWCGLWCLALGAVYRRFAEGPQRNFQVAAYFAFLPIFVIAFRDGLLLTILRTAVFYLAPIVAWALVARAMGVVGPTRRVPAPSGRQVVPDAPPGPVLQHAPRPRRASHLEEAIVPRAWRRPGQVPQGE